MSISKLYIFAALLLALIGVCSCSINPKTNTDDTEQPKTTFDKSLHQKEFDEISNINRSFYWLGIVIEPYREQCKVAYRDYLHCNFDNLLELYPDTSFFRLLRWACLYEKIEINSTQMDKLIKIYRENLTYDSDSYIDVEKTDALMLLVARSEYVFKNLPKDLQEYVMSLSFANYIVYKEYQLNFRKCIQHNYADQVVPFVLDVLVNNRRDILDHHDYDIVYRMADYLALYARGNNAEKMFDMLKTAENQFTTKQVQLDHYYTVYTVLMWELKTSRRDDVFVKFFKTNPDWYIYDLDPEEYDLNLKDKTIADPESIRNVLTWERLHFLVKHWNEVQSNEIQFDAWRKILIFLGSGFNYKACPGWTGTMEFMIFYPTIDYINEINSIKDSQELKETIEDSISLRFTDCFIEYDNGYIVKDKWLHDRFQPIDMQRDRLIYKWRYGDPGYGSPTFPTECFIDWDLHRAEFPNYSNMRKQYVAFIKQLNR